MRNPQGFILITTLLTITVVTFLVLGSMQQMLLCYKAINALALENEALKEMENLVNHLAKSNNCPQVAESANTALRLLANGFGCAINFASKPYRYLISEWHNNANWRLITAINKDNDVLQVMYYTEKNKMELPVKSWRFLKGSIHDH